MDAAHSFAASLAHVLGEQASSLPDPPPGLPAAAWRGWLAERNLGLVPVSDPHVFAWPGAFIGRLSGEPGGWVVMFGVPPGILWDPAGGLSAGTVDEAFVVASLDRGIPAGEHPYGDLPATDGRVEAIVIAPAAEAEAVEVERARAIAGRGLEGDRYTAGTGTFSGGPGGGRALTLVEAEVLDHVGLAPVQARRNVVTRGIDLNGLVGRRFRVGHVECAGRRLCEPCAHLERLTEPGVLRALVHRGGLRADVLSDGEIELGAAVVASG